MTSNPMKKNGLIAATRTILLMIEPVDTPSKTWPSRFDGFPVKRDATTSAMPAAPIVTVRMV